MEDILKITVSELKREKGRSMYEATVTISDIPDVAEVGKSPAEAIGLLIISMSSLDRYNTIKIIDSCIQWDRYYERNWHELAFKKGMPDFEIRVKFDNHTPTMFKGHPVFIDDLGGFRVMHRELQKHEEKVFAAFIAEYGFNVFYDKPADKQSSVIIPAANY